MEIIEIIKWILLLILIVGCIISKHYYIKDSYDPTKDAIENNKQKSKS
jgi:hypothetical protein